MEDIPQTDPTPAGRPRQHYSAAFKTDLIARATVPGASVSAVAREHGINANQLFKWIASARKRGINANQLFKWIASARKRGALAPKPAPTAAMVPVGLSLPAPGAATSTTSSRAPTASALEVRLSVATLRFEGTWEPASVAALVRLLGS